ncbi:MAG TPA: F0F1 ATP synthase subunit B [Chloroflexota bacterium]|nr:F0F1 ATP synthase subunit B [Chloroflexota bacterium]
MEALGINAPGLLAQIINFFLLLVLLRLVAYKPIMNMLDQRAARIRESMDRAESVQREAQRMEQEFAERVAEARREGQAIVTNANQIAQRIQTESREKASQDAEAFLTRAREQIDRERERAIAELRSQVADLAILAASKVVERSLDEKQHYELIDRVLAQSEKIGKG